MAERTIIKNAHCMTMDHGSRAEWISIRGDRIEAIGNGDAYKALASAEDTVLDARGNTVLPGFIDNHFHLLTGALAKEEVDLSSCRSVEEVCETIRQSAGDREAIIGYGLSEDRMEERRYPTRVELDRCCDDHPVVIYSLDYHTLILNTYAILYYKVPFALPGVELDHKGMPTGIFRERAGGQLDYYICEHFTDGDYQEAIEKFLPDVFASGITTTAAMEGRNCGNGNGRESQCEFLVRREAEYPLSMELFYQTTDIDLVLSHGLRRIGGALYLDGTLGSWSAALTEDYADRPGKRGRVFYTQEFLNDFVLHCCEQGLQIGFDAIGDVAIDAALTAIESASDKFDVRSMRHRIEHGDLLRTDQMRKAADLGVVFSVQPSYEAHWGYPGGMKERRLGHRYGQTLQLRKMLDSGILLCGGSDHPTTSLNPMAGVQAAVLHPVEANRIKLEEALELYTIKGAYALFLEEDRGSLTPGKRADVVILDRDIETCPMETLAQSKPVMTVKDGTILYNRGL